MTGVWVSLAGLFLAIVIQAIVVAHRQGRQDERLDQLAARQAEDRKTYGDALREAREDAKARVSEHGGQSRERDDELRATLGELTREIGRRFDQLQSIVSASTSTLGHLTGRVEALERVAKKSDPHFRPPARDPRRDP